MEAVVYPKFKSRYSKEDNKIYVSIFDPDFLSYVDSFDIDLSSYSSEEADLLLNMPAGELLSITRELNNYITEEDLPF